MIIMIVTKWSYKVVDVPMWYFWQYRGSNGGNVNSMGENSGVGVVLGWGGSDVVVMMVVEVPVMVMVVTVVVIVGLAMIVMVVSW